MATPHRIDPEAFNQLDAFAQDRILRQWSGWLGGGVTREQLIRSNMLTVKAIPESFVNPSSEALRELVSPGAIQQLEGFQVVRVVRRDDGQVDVYGRRHAFGRLEHLVLQANVLDDPQLWTTEQQRLPSVLDRIPFRIWAPSADNGLAWHGQIEQMRHCQVVVLMGLRQTAEIPLVDADGYPLFGPELPPLVIARRQPFQTPFGSGDDPVDDPRIRLATGTFGATYMSNEIGWPIVGKTNVNPPVHSSVKWFLRLDRDPMPHWVIVANWDHLTLSESDVVKIVLLFGIIGQGSIVPGGSQGVNIEVGASWAHGHYSVKMIWDLVGDVDSRDVINGTQAEFNRRKMCTIAESIAAGTLSANLYFRTPNALLADTAVFTSQAEPPTVLVLGEFDDAAPSLTDQTNWKPSSLGVGLPGTPYQTLWNDPPAHIPNAARWEFNSDVAWDDPNSQWFLTIRNSNPTTTKSFYAWAWAR